MGMIVPEYEFLFADVGMNGENWSQSPFVANFRYKIN